MDEREITVSITSLAYNQAEYIRKALDGFVMQKTDFAFEIIVHDDASTDGTAEIIREYEAKYPDLMRPIYETENQWSKGVKIGVQMRQKARGKYIACCEADDYWTDPNKLQKQVDFMEAHPEYSMCAHYLATVDEDGNPLSEAAFRVADCDRDYTAEDVILYGGGLFQTNSMLMRREYMRSYPDFYLHATVGDYPMQIYMGMCGKIRYLDERMSVYRVSARGSWSAKTLGSVERTLKHYDNMCKMLAEAVEYDGGKYKDVCERRIALFRMYAALLRGDAAAVKQLRPTLRAEDVTRNLKIGMCFPRLFGYLKRRRMKANSKRK